jgi:hypothetical protein
MDRGAPSRAERALQKVERAETIKQPMIYVDDMKAGFGQMIMCHMIADTTEELIVMAKSIGVQTKWIQKAGTYSEHFDICLSKRALAVTKGAIEISQMELGRKLLRKRRNKTAFQLVAEDSL